MAYHKSAAKRAKQNLKKNAVNSSYINGVRTAVKGFRKVIADLAAGVEKDMAKAQPLFMQAQSKVMKAASKGLVHKNNAARTVARLAHLLAKATGGTTVAPTVVVKKAVKKAPATNAAKKKASKKA